MSHAYIDLCICVHYSMQAAYHKCNTGVNIILRAIPDCNRAPAHMGSPFAQVFAGVALVLGQYYMLLYSEPSAYVSTCRIGSLVSKGNDVYC